MYDPLEFREIRKIRGKLFFVPISCEVAAPISYNWSFLKSQKKEPRMKTTVLLVIAFASLLIAVGCSKDPAEPAAATKGASAPEDVAGPPGDAEKLPDGLASKVLKKGTGTQKPTPTSTVTVHYTGWTTDGRMFDSSAGGAPASFPLSQVIRGWTEGVGLMVVGEKRRLWIPQDLAYQGRPGAPAGMLVFDVELLAIQ